jgi:UDP-2-acetamido-3-amino-2,3-dideoxy-glucuronate N-acetyltransferase
MSYFVHESSYIDENVKIGDGTSIWHFSHVMSNVMIGEKCSLGQNVHIGPNVRIGNNVKIQNNVSVYEGVTLEDDVFCGPSMVFTNVEIPRSAYPKDSSEYLSTLVCKGVSIGANAIIVCGITLGKHSFVGAGSVVTKDIPDYALVYGVPAEIKGWMCECGNKLLFTDDKAECSKCDRKYQRISKEKIKLLL